MQCCVELASKFRQGGILALELLERLGVIGLHPAELIPHR
jgi:hypothetical protein